MRNFVLSILVFFTLSSFSVHNNSGLPATAQPSAAAQIDPVPMDRITKMKIKEAEKLLGRKFTLKEKIAFKIAQLKLKKDLKAKEEGKSSKGQTAMILGIIGIACIIIPFGIIASIPLAILAIVMGSQAKKANKNDGKAQTGIILGIVTLGLVALAIILVAIWLASWGWY